MKEKSNGNKANNVTVVFSVSWKFWYLMATISSQNMCTYFFFVIQYPSNLFTRKNCVYYLPNESHLFVSLTTHSKHTHNTVQYKT